MKTLRLKGGDLVPGPGGVETITGVDRLVQDLRCALSEPVGNDRFHPGWGSRIDEFIGMPLDEATAFAVEQEILRVIGNYMAVQEEKVRMAQATGTETRYSSSEVLARVRRVTVRPQRDRLHCIVEIENLAGQFIALDTEVTRG
jgi:phage baseplate assembly protein W